ncbi:hypothetical protein LMANV2_170045 [Leptospira interrogans serovar Manilae]|uniref:Uncharacterized protein n=1 Tax=Leptospira interrogans serovar Manilae TaxID=214675 RepID=A0AAQ1SMJ3_LEPIR|nr:hypothetical protein LMANV2_170045 [Leptospira interrogans serovar Manilae]
MISKTYKCGNSHNSKKTIRGSIFYFTQNYIIKYSIVYISVLE